jgi:N-acetylmuramoyl-L-alanine amidase
MRRVISLVVLVFIVAGHVFCQRANLSGIKICIDPGHGGHSDATDRHVIPDPGTNFYESESNFQKALHLKALLEAKGATVILTRYTNDYPTDAEPSLAARVQTANLGNVNWFHSIHSNATGLASNTSTNYTMIMVREKVVAGGDAVYGPGTGQPETQEAWSIADLIGPNIRDKMRTQRSLKVLDWTFYGGNNGGYTLGVLRGLQMPGELSEGEFHDYYPETRRLMNNSYCKMEAYALRDAFLQYYGVPADTLCIVAGILSNASGVLINGAKVRLLPENIVYTGDNYNNGFYMFDSLKAGPHTLSFETPNYETASVPVTLVAGKTLFLDRSFVGGAPATIRFFGPSSRDTLYPVNQTIGLSFSAAMDTASVRQAFSITPPVSGTITWFNSLTTSFVFRPDQPFQYLTWYTYRLAATARTMGGGYFDGNGDGTTGDDFVVTFRTMPQPVSAVEESAIPALGIAQNYPNPFNPTTNFELRIANLELVTLKVFDVLGREVATLLNEMRPAGVYTVRWDASLLPSGVYFYQLRAGDFVQTKKLVLAK